VAVSRVAVDFAVEAEVDSVRAGAVFEVEDSLVLAGSAARHAHTAEVRITARVSVTAGVGRSAALLTEVEHTVAPRIGAAAGVEPEGRLTVVTVGRRTAVLDFRAPAAQ
jgi:hypothetical protein